MNNLNKKNFKICELISEDPFFNSSDNAINKKILEDLIQRRALLKHTIPLLTWLLKESVARDEKYLYHFYENPPILAILRKERAEAKSGLKESSDKLQDLMDKIEPIEIQVEELEKDLEDAEASKRPAIEDEIKELNTEIKALRQDVQKINRTIRDLQDIIEVTGEALQKNAVFEKRVAQDQEKIEKQGEINFSAEFSHMKKLFSDIYSPSVLKDMAEKVNISLRTNAIKKRERIKKKEIASQSIFKRVASYFSEDEQVEEVRLNPAEIIDTADFSISSFTLKDFFGESYFTSRIKLLDSKEKRAALKPLSGYLMRKKDKELKVYAQALIDLQSTNYSVFLSLNKTISDIKEEYKRLYNDIEIFKHRVSNSLLKRVTELCNSYINLKNTGENTNEVRSELNREWLNILSLIIEKKVDLSLKNKTLELKFNSFESNFIRYGIITPEIFDDPFFTEIQKTKFSESFLDLNLDKVDTISVNYLDNEISRWFLTQDIYQGWTEQKGPSRKEVTSLKIKALSKFRPALKEYKALKKAASIVDSIMDITGYSLYWNFLGWYNSLLAQIRSWEVKEKLLNAMPENNKTNSEQSEQKNLNNRAKNIKSSRASRIKSDLFIILEKRLAQFIIDNKKSGGDTTPELILYLANYINYNRQETDLINKNTDRNSVEFINLRIAKGNAFDLLVNAVEKIKSNLLSALRGDSENSGSSCSQLAKGSEPFRKFAFFDESSKVTKRLLGSIDELADFKKSIKALLSKVEEEISSNWGPQDEIKESVLTQVKTIANYNDPGKSFIPFPENTSSCSNDFSLDKFKKFVKNFTLKMDPLFFTQIAADTATNTIENKKFFPTYVNYKRKAKLQLPDALKSRQDRLILFHSKMWDHISKISSLVSIRDTNKIHNCLDSIIDTTISGICLVDSDDLTKTVKTFLSTYVEDTHDFKPDTTGPIKKNTEKINIERSKSASRKISKIENSLYGLFETRLYNLTEYYKYNKSDKKKIVPVSKKNPTNADVTLGLSNARQLAIETFGQKHTYAIEDINLSISFFKNRLKANLIYLKTAVNEYRSSMIDKSAFSKLKNQALASFFDAAYYIKYYSESNPAKDIMSSMYNPLAYKLEETARGIFDSFAEITSQGTTAQQADSLTPLIDGLELFINDTFELHPDVKTKALNPDNYEKIPEYSDKLREFFFHTLAVQTGLNNKKQAYVGTQISALGAILSDLKSSYATKSNTDYLIYTKKLLAYAADISTQVYSRRHVIQNFNVIECAPPNILLFPGNIDVSGFYPSDDIDDEDLRKTKEYHQFMRDPDNGNIWKFQMFPPRNINDFLIDPLYKFRVMCDKMTVTFRDNQGYLYKKFPKNLWHEKIIALKNAGLIHKLLKIYYSSFDKSTSKIFTKDNTVLPVKGKLERPVVNPKKLDDLHDYFNLITGISDDKSSGNTSIITDIILEGASLNDQN